MRDIRPGYLLKINTWENDWDNHNSVDIDGLSENDVRFFIHVAKAFESHAVDSLGNEDLHGDEFNKRLYTHIEKFDGTIPSNWDLETAIANDPDDAEYFYYDNLGSIGIISNEHGFWRVFESAQVFHIPETIKDVTAKFK